MKKSRSPRLHVHYVTTSVVCTAVSCITSGSDRDVSATTSRSCATEVAQNPATTENRLGPFVGDVQRCWRGVFSSGCTDPHPSIYYTSNNRSFTIQLRAGWVVGPVKRPSATSFPVSSLLGDHRRKHWVLFFASFLQF